MPLSDSVAKVHSYGLVLHSLALSAVPWLFWGCFTPTREDFSS